MKAATLPQIFSLSIRGEHTTTPQHASLLGSVEPLSPVVVIGPCHDIPRPLCGQDLVLLISIGIRTLCPTRAEKGSKSSHFPPYIDRKCIVRRGPIILQLCM